MTEAARINLQKGVPEDKRFPWTNYTPESALDNWILSHMKIREQLITDRELDATAKAAAAELEKRIEKELDKLLKDFK